jgi:hypothetical protein
MRLLVDDEIYNVNAVWLGPPRKTLPWRARYVAYAVGAVVFVVLQMVQRRLGIGLGFFTLAYSLLVTIALTRLILAAVDNDRPIGAVVTGFVNEVSAPRRKTTTRTHTYCPARVSAVPAPPSRARGRHDGSARRTGRLRHHHDSRGHTS